jgi:hypothetical protein
LTLPFIKSSSWLIRYFVSFIFTKAISMKRVLLLLSATILAFAVYAQREIKKAPEVKEGDGPFTQLIIRGVMLIDGTGAPPVLLTL